MIIAPSLGSWQARQEALERNGDLGIDGGQTKVAKPGQATYARPPKAGSSEGPKGRSVRGGAVGR
jgi:hypothetical protein